MNKLEAIAANIPFLPEWAKIIALNLFGIYVILQIIHLILKKLQTPELRNVMSVLKSLSGKVLHTAGRSLELPVQRPKLAIVALALNMVLFYAFALIFFAFFGIFLMLGATVEDVALIKRLLGFGVAGVFLIISRWYYASAERQRIELIEQWRSIRRSN